ncbi:unnamed protein product [Lota lota]
MLMSGSHAPGVCDDKVDQTRALMLQLQPDWDLLLTNVTPPSEVIGDAIFSLSASKENPPLPPRLHQTACSFTGSLRTIGQRRAILSTSSVEDEAEVQAALWRACGGKVAVGGSQTQRGGLINGRPPRDEVGR